jgi:hypothetical protein
MAGSVMVKIIFGATGAQEIPAIGASFQFQIYATLSRISAVRIC